ncbi:polysaccharide biosynthesis tyrosine autokinase [Chamaesiphon sp. VAR_69_metabat_338]|uniref:GumC family protein n=1 Tax=Chamaesiphon sp. VAR_69_metabat_338 TaxID=2964704 RepID=UPI00286E7627|nr:polysaccharide biosynthesis tyrosine autokinase [Chamaesiphon sp. VAR_69_metabat_338]
MKRRWKPALIIFAATVATGIFAASILKPSYQADGRLLFKNSTYKIVGANLTPSNIEGGESGDLKPLVSTQNPLSTQIEVMSARSLLQQTIDRLQLKNKDGKPLTVVGLQSKLAIKLIGGADILQVSYKDNDPQLAAKVVNTIMQIYIENDIAVTRAEAENVSQFMARQLPQTRRSLTQAEIAIRKFKQQNQVVDLAEESKTAVSKIANLESEITTAKSQLAELTAQNQELHQKISLNSQDAMTFSATSQSPAIQGILAQIQDLERQLAIENSRFSNNNPIVIGLEEKKVKLTALLKQQILSATGSATELPAGALQVSDTKQNLIKELLQSEVKRTGALDKVSSLQNALSAYKKRVRVMPQLVQTQNQLERQLEVSKSTYQNLLKKVQELELAKNNKASNARIVDKASVPDRAENNIKYLIGGLSVLGGAFLATSAIAYLEMIAKPAARPEDVSKIFRHRLLGPIPDPNSGYFSDNSSLQQTQLEAVVSELRQSLATEMSQIIQFNLKFANSKKVLKTIAITSTVPNEEKSQKAANLAAAIAGLGQRVLLVDADIRNPYQHQVWNLPLNKGLSELLAGTAQFQKVAWPVMDNLNVLTAGITLPTSLFSFDSEQMKLLVQEVSQSYDFAIVDMPPLLVSPNAMNLGQMNDGILTIDLND